MSDVARRWFTGVVLMTICLLFAVHPAMAEGRKVRVRVEPVYPQLAKQMRIEGTVRIQVTVSPTGKVSSAKTLGGHALLAEAGIDAVKKWQFQPAPAETSEVVEFHFSMR